jgi:predicted nucleotidyltransferase
MRSSSPIIPVINPQALPILRQIENEYDVRVIFAVESGSRAWGFASKDSDYDIRYIYVRRPEFYYSIDVENQRDVLDENKGGPKFPYPNDLSGWDLRKSLRMMQGSSVPLMEWLTVCPIYRSDKDMHGRLLGLAREYWRPRVCAYHHHSMAKKIFKEHLNKPVVVRKKYLYALRSIMAFRWVFTYPDQPVPIRFTELLDATAKNEERDPIRELIIEKRGSEELGEAPQNELFTEIIQDDLVWHDHAIPELPGELNEDMAPLNLAFRTIINTVDTLWDVRYGD